MNNPAYKPPEKVMQRSVDARRMRILIQDESGQNLVDETPVDIPTVLPLKIVKVYLPEIALKAVRGKLDAAAAAMGFK